MTKSGLLGAVAGAALLAVGGAGTANAVPAYAYANLAFSGFDLDLGGGTIVGIPTVSDQASSSYTGFPNGGGAPASGNIISGVTAIPAMSGPTGALITGDASNAAAFAPQLTVASGSQAQASLFGPITAALSQLTAESHVTTGGITAGAQSNTNTSLVIDFMALTTSVTLSFTATDSGTAEFGNNGDAATSAVNATYKLTDITGGGSIVIENVSPTDLNQNAIAPLPGDPASYSLAPTAFVFSSPIIIGHEYQVNLTDQAATTVTAALVPEPFSIALLGSGVLALGVIRRRRKI